MEGRGKGWLTSAFHAYFREISLHVAIRENLLCPLYALMPDHIHLVWMGINPASNQRFAATFLRTYLEPAMAPHRFQHQPHDHVLRDEERKRKAFIATCAYIADNPVRAGLVAARKNWQFTGCLVPGYPALDPGAQDFWDKFWRVYNGSVGNGHVGKLVKSQDQTPAS